jgi:hypothetical protein
MLYGTSPVEIRSSYPDSDRKKFISIFVNGNDEGTWHNEVDGGPFHVGVGVAVARDSGGSECRPVFAPVRTALKNEVQDLE